MKMLEAAMKASQMPQFRRLGADRNEDRNSNTKIDFE